MMKVSISLLLLLLGSNCYAVGNPQFLEDNIRGVQEALNSTEFGQKYKTQTDQMFDTTSMVAKNISNGNFDQANRVSAEEMTRLKVEFAKRLGEIDRSQWVSVLNGFNNISSIQFDKDEMIKMAEKFRR